LDESGRVYFVFVSSKFAGHLSWIYLLIIGLRPVYGIGIWKIVLFNADLAALSAFSLPEIPTWLGNQQNITLEGVNKKTAIF